MTEIDLRNEQTKVEPIRMDTPGINAYGYKVFISNSKEERYLTHQEMYLEKSAFPDDTVFMTTI